MGLNFCTGIVVDLKDGNGEHFEAVEYDKLRVAWQYVKSWFFIDLFSGVPFALISLLMGTGGDFASNAKSLKALRFLKLARLLKLGRLLKIEKILSTMDRDTIDVIQDFFHVSPTGVFFFPHECYLREKEESKPQPMTSSQ